MESNRPQIPRYLAAQCFLGCVVALVVLLVVLATDTGGIATLVAASSDPVTVVIILVMGAITTIVPLVVATAIGLLALRDERNTVSQPLDCHGLPAAVQAAPATARRRR